MLWQASSRQQNDRMADILSMQWKCDISQDAADEQE